MTTPPSTITVRVTLASGRILGLDYFHEGFAPTVPCTHDGCYMPANAIVYEIGVQGRLYRFCMEHMPTTVLKYIKTVLEDIQKLRDE